MKNLDILKVKAINKNLSKIQVYGQYWLSLQWKMHNMSIIQQAFYVVNNINIIITQAEQIYPMSVFRTCATL
jgi:hypothetical protein